MKESSKLRSSSSPGPRHKFRAAAMNAAEHAGSVGAREPTACAGPGGYPARSEDAIVRAAAMLAHEVSTMSASLQVLLTSLMSSRVTW
jgi:hypothetical protein